MAVANSRESLPFSSRERTKTGMATCSRAPFRSSFLDNLADTCPNHLSDGLCATKGGTLGAKLRKDARQS